MTHEHPQPPRQPKPGDEFGLTEHEQLFDRVGHERLLQLLEDPDMTVHQVEESYNNYGSFLFVTMSKLVKNRRILVTFWGLGFHESRERYITQEWFWYFANPFPPTLQSHVDKEEAKQTIQERHHKMAAHAQENTQSRRGKLFETIADLTDEDGASVELEDLPWWLLSDDDE